MTRINGLGDIVTTAFFSPANSGRIIWGVGPVFLLPAATTLRSDRRSSASVLPSSHSRSPAMDGRLLFNHIWSVSGANDRDDVNPTFLQPFLNYNLGAGFQ